MKRFRLVAAAAAVLVLAARWPGHGGDAHAAWPPNEGDDLKQRVNQPNDPGYPGRWNYFSYIPDSVLRPGELTEYERMIGSGFHADRAWIKTQGNPQILIGELDSGIEWNSDDLTNRFYLSRGELPEPEAACRGTVPRNPADGWDANGDGRFNMQDYSNQSGGALPTTACDSRVSDKNGNGILDPEDLIMTFSDNTDADNNGYIDDISGWDFFDNDNNPKDDVQFGHGTGEANDSTAQANNGRGSAGVCPDCSVVMLRCGDSFVVDAGDFAMATLYAVDNGASIIQEALGGINGPALAFDAIDYAYKNGVIVVASAADENSFHHNLPGTANHTWYVHATRYDSDGIEAAKTFNAFNNCTNYGPQLALSVPGTACSSEATGRGAGISGLLYSFALKQNLQPPDGQFATDLTQSRRLSAGEVLQLLNMNVDDIYDPSIDTDAKALARGLYLNRPGWEQRFGYGRVNVRKALDAIEAGRIPPEVDVTSPKWFALVDPGQTPMVAVTGSITYRQDLFSSYDYVVEWAKGVEPMDTDWKTLSMGQQTTMEQKDATLAMFDLSSITVDEPPMPEPDLHVNKHLVTLRVRVTLHSADNRLEGTKGEARRSFQVHRDSTLLPGFPIKLPSSMEASVKLADLDGDGKREIIAVDSGGIVHAFKVDGSELPGWPAKLNPHPALAMGAPQSHRTQRAFMAGGLSPDRQSGVAINVPAVGDLDLDGKKEVVVSSYDGFLFVFEPDGTTRAGFPVQIDRANANGASTKNFIDDGFTVGPLLWDVDKDTKLEIVQAGSDGFVYIWRADGSKQANWPKKMQDGDQQRRIVSAPAVGDLDGDGNWDIVTTTTESYDGDSFGRVYAVRASDGSALPGFPFRLRSTRVLPLVGEGLPNSPALADLDGDGKDEVTVSGIASIPKVIRADGSGKDFIALSNNPYGTASNSDDVPSVILIANPSFGDLNNDGTPDLVQPAAGFGAAKAFAGSGKRENFDHHLDAWNLKTGKFFPGFPHRMDDWQFFMNPAVVDVDNDGKVEAISASGGYYVRAVDVNGKEPKGWPKFTGQWITSAPTLGDLDNDGKLELVITTRSGYVFAWHTDGLVKGRVDWPTFAHDNWNSNNFNTPLEFGKRAGSGGGGGGCEIALHGGRGVAGLAGLALVLGALLLVLTRRPR